MNVLWFYVLGTLAAVILTGFLVWKLDQFRRSESYQQGKNPFIKFLKWEEKLILELNGWLKRLTPRKGGTTVRWDLIGEILLIGAWAFWVGRVYLNLDSTVIANGREFNSAIQTHHFWTRFGECGLCALWNGSVRGGYPALADVHGSTLHPLVILTTAIFGVVNGAKISLLLALWLGGIAQWWISRELDLSRVPRLWTSAMAVVAGHLSGRMELGAFGVLLSTAMASLVFGAVLGVAKGRGNRAVVLLGAALSLTILSGQGYIQIGLLGTVPALGILVLDQEFHIKNNWKDFILAALIAGLLSAILLVPFLHFSPNFNKAVDLEFGAAQPFKYIPLNYVINSYDFYQSRALGKLPYPHLYVLFIGWIPVILALIGLRDKKASSPVKWYFIVSILLILGISSGDLLRLIGKIWKGVGGIRHPTQIAGLTVPLILGFSGLGLEKILALDWPRLEFRSDQGGPLEKIALPTKVLLILPLIFSLRQGYLFSKHWVGTHQLGQEVYQVIEELKTDSLQWVQPPYGEHFYIEPAVREGLKLSPGIMTWQWEDREFPAAYYEASHTGQPVGTAERIAKVNTIGIYSRPEAEYAVVRDEQGSTPCTASGTGGNIQVSCDVPRDGRLVIKEYYWTGWKGWLDGRRVSIFGYPWISTEVPSGFHTYTFRYRPWDVPLGLALTVIGIVACLIIWHSPHQVSNLLPPRKKHPPDG